MKAILIAIIRVYQICMRGGALAPLWMNYSSCRSWPTCSDYAINAIKTHGVLRGTVKAASRVIHCHP